MRFVCVLRCLYGYGMFAQPCIATYCSMLDCPHAPGQHTYRLVCNTHSNFMRAVNLIRSKCLQSTSGTPKQCALHTNAILHPKQTGCLQGKHDTHKQSVRVSATHFTITYPRSSTPHNNPDRIPSTNPRALCTTSICRPPTRMLLTPRLPTASLPTPQLT